MLSRHCKRLLATSLLIVAASPSYAQTLTWGTGGTGGTANWNTTNLNWFDGTNDVVWANGSIAQFPNVAGTVTVADPGMTTPGMTFNHTTGSYVLLASGGNTVGLTGSATVTQNNATDFVRIGANAGASVISGASGFNKAGLGELVLGSALSSTGGLSVSQGVLTLGDRTQTTINLTSGTGITNGNAVVLGNNTTLRLAANVNANASLTAVQMPSVTISGNTTISSWKVGAANSFSPSLGSTLIVDAAGSTLNYIAQGSSSTNTITFNRLTFANTILNGPLTVQTQPFISGTSVSNMSLSSITDNGNSITWQGGGSATVLSADSFRITLASAMTGNWTIGNVAGTQGATVSLSGTGITSTLTSGTVTINPYSSLLFFAPGNYGAVGQTINVNGIGAQLADFSAGTSGAIRTNTNAVIGIASNLVLQSDSYINTVGSSSSLTVTGTVAGAGGITKQGAGTLILSGAGSYNGATNINNGTIRLGGTADGVSPSSIVNLGQAGTANVGTLDLNGFNQTIAGLNSVAGTNTSSTNNNIVTSATPAILTVDTSTTNFFGDGSNANSGVITGAISLVKNGPGRLTLEDSNNYTGTTTVNNGALIINGPNTGGSTYTVNAGGTLGGIGAIVAPVNINGGTLAPGNSPGMLTINGALSFTSSSTFAVELNGTTAGSLGYDQLTIGGTGSITLNNANLFATLGFAPSVNDIFFIIQNLSSNPVSGIFNNLPEGSSVSFSGYTGNITYLANFSTPSLTGGFDVAIYNLTLSVPEPGSIALMALAGFGVVQWYLRKQKQQSVTSSDEESKQPIEATPTATVE